MTDDERLYSVREAATVLGLGVSQVYRLVTKGLIPAERLGRGWVIRQTALDSYHPRRVGRPRTVKPPRAPSQNPGGRPRKVRPTLTEALRAAYGEQFPEE